VPPDVAVYKYCLLAGEAMTPSSKFEKKHNEFLLVLKHTTPPLLTFTFYLNISSMKTLLGAQFNTRYKTHHKDIDQWQGNERLSNPNLHYSLFSPPELFLRENSS
jgi:hypothetical protein